MILESPLGLLALSSIALVVILHRLRQRPERRDIGSLFIWKKIEQYITASPVRKKSRLYMILFLQILSVIFLSFALAKPVWRITQPEPLHLVFLIDNSASMGSASFEGSGNTYSVIAGGRWAVMKEKIKEVIVKSPADTTVSLYQVSPLKSFIQLKRYETFNVINNLTLMEISSDVETLVSLSQGIKGELYFCSDKLPSESVLNRFSQKPHLILVGQPSDNKAIIHAAATPTPNKKDYYDIFVTVKNYSSRPANNIAIDVISTFKDSPDKVLGHEKINLGTNEKRDLFFNDVHLPEKSRLKIVLDSKDEMMRDNEVWLMTPDPYSINIIGKKSPALIKALKSIPSIFLDDTSSYHDITVFNETLPVTLPAKSIIINSIPANNLFWNYQGETINPVVTGIDTSSPILKYCDLNVFNNIPSAVKLLPVEKEYLKPIIKARGLDGEDCVLLGEWQRGEQQMIILNFPVEWRSEIDSVDWTLTPSFPIFWTNLINYFHPLSKDYTLGSGLCNEEESDNNGISVMDTVQPPANNDIKKEIRRIDFAPWSIFTAGILLVLSWILGRTSL
ncbi:MAG: BatA domain-containing protein [Planctomycetota bacterium]